VLNNSGILKKVTDYVLKDITNVMDQVFIVL